MLSISPATPLLPSVLRGEHLVQQLDRDPIDVDTSGTVSTDEQACDYFRLTSKDGEAAIEVFVFDGGKTDVYFVKYLPLYKIEEMMPSA